MKISLFICALSLLLLLSTVSYEAEAKIKIGSILGAPVNAVKRAVHHVAKELGHHRSRRSVASQVQLDSSTTTKVKHIVATETEPKQFDVSQLDAAALADSGVAPANLVVASQEVKIVLQSATGDQKYMSMQLAVDRTTGRVFVIESVS